MRDSEASPVLPSERLHPRVRTLWQLSDGLFGALVAAGGIAAIVLSSAPASLAVVVLLVVGPPAVIAPRLRFERWRYEIRARDVLLSRGLLFHTIAAIPFDRIQYVETTQGPLDRWFRLMQLEVRTAGGTEKIPGLTVAEAERLREELSRVAGTASV